jgi:glutamate synthase domain-containing protein 2/glutamate synthase domain-containing protein 1/glutamate synthase domain-containing protein 3
MGEGFRGTESTRVASSPIASTAPEFPLYDVTMDRDACGVGFIADRRAIATHRTLRRAIACLSALDHRGAKAADGTGDGAGILTRIPYRLLAHELEVHSIDVPPRERLAVAMVFLPDGQADWCRGAVEEAFAGEGTPVVHWRRVPYGPNALGQLAAASMPRIEQAIIVAADDVEDEDAFERRLLLARKGAERTATELGIEGFSIPSASGRTVVYKGLFTARNIDAFYWDLTDPVYETDFAVFHQRYSTNTFPSWDRAQPARILAHNGEINTIGSNRAWMTARGVDLRSAAWGDRAGDLRPLVGPDSSDSGSLDDVVELLVRSGRSLAHAKEMLIPAAWENVSDLDPELRAFYEYHAFLTEPWDGPAALAGSDGVTLLAAMDRNGLRPARWTITPDTVLVASEVGLIAEVEIEATATGQLGPGELVVVDLETGDVRFSDEVRKELASRRPYVDWISTQTAHVQHPFDPLQDDRFDAEALARAFGYTAEERRLILKEMAEGRTPVLSMGNDSPLAVLGEAPQRLSRYFHQMFAQVTNPPVDPIRERLVMSLRAYLGRRGSMLEETPQQARLIELASPVLSDAEVGRVLAHPEFRSAWLPVLFPVSKGAEGLLPAIEALKQRSEMAVREGATIVVLSDRETDADNAAIPMLLAVGAVHHHLLRAGLRLRASIVAVSGEPRDAHDLACLVAFGASAINPYLAIEQVREMAARGDVDVDPVVAQENYRRVTEEGLLKILSKMGICTISAYRGSELFEVIGLDDEVLESAFRFAPSRIGGAGFPEIAKNTLELHSALEGDPVAAEGYYKHRRGGVPHVNSPKAVLSLKKAARSGDPEDWQAYLAEVAEDRPVAQLRDLVRLAQREPVPLDEVEPAEAIMRRFSTAAMSLGALSREAHEALAEAMTAIGGLSNSGEGGEDPGRFGTARNSGIKQVASGRFGVTPGYLASAEELQIKMAQGSKPGEGGQLPGHKVSPEIAGLRHTEPGVTLISPPPHHDIYSIEDLAQLVFDLKTFAPEKRVTVKLVSEPGVGTIAVGVAKAKADAVLISGSEGGTGASSLVSIKHAGSPWELGLAEAHQALVANSMREDIILETDGGLRTGRDVVVAALLGADRFGFGTLPLLALGCKMVRQCHENTCPVGIATQDLDLRAKFTGAPEQVVSMFRLLAEEVRGHLAALGSRTLEEVIGRADLLELADHPTAQSLGDRLVRARFSCSHEGYKSVERSALGDALAAQAVPAIEAGRRLDTAYPVRNTDRAVGTRLSGLIAAEHGDQGLDDDSIRIRLSGFAGQSLGAFLVPGVSIRLDGVANDYVGKGMGGGKITIVPASRTEGRVPHAAGNAVLYGATGGRVFIAGSVGQRFAVRNSGAAAVVEGCSDHGCEYMTGGTVVLLGPPGRNLAAGMTGGVLYVYDPEGVAPRHLADTAPSAVRPGATDLIDVKGLLSQHLAATGSRTAQEVLANWESATAHFWVLRARTRPAEHEVDESVSVDAVGGE